ncbi:MAG: hypothetical protein RLZZ162_2956, partial [Verrucomicrobiota bacterium]
LSKVVVLDGEDEARAVGGQIKGASAADGPQVFGSDGPELGCRRGLGGAEECGRGEESEEGEAGQTADEGEKEGCHRKERTRTITGNEYDYAYADFSKIAKGGCENFSGAISMLSERRSQRAPRKLVSTSAFGDEGTDIVFVRRKIPQVFEGAEETGERTVHIDGFGFL